MAEDNNKKPKPTPPPSSGDKYIVGPKPKRTILPSIGDQVTNGKIIAD